MSRPFLYVLLIVSLVFVALGIAMVVSGASVGWSALLFFAVCAAVFVWQLWPGMLERKSPSVEALLARYPGSLELKTAPTKLVFFALFSAALGGVMLWMLLHESLGIAMQIALWPGVALFLGGVPFLLFMLIKGASLRLDREGFEIVQAWRRSRTHWRDASPFELAVVSGTLQRMVVFDDAAQASSKLAAMNRSLTGRTSALPDTYGLSLEALSELMNAWQARALASRPD